MGTQPHHGVQRRRRSRVGQNLGLAEARKRLGGLDLRALDELR